MSIEVVNRENWKKHLLGIVLLSILLSISNLFDQQLDVLIWLKSFSITFLYTAALWLGNSFITNILNRYISWTDQPGRRVIFGVITMILYTLLVVVIILETAQWYHQYTISSSSYIRTLLVTVLITAVVSLIFHARAFLVNWRQAAIDKERLEKAHVLSQYQTLRNQVNPHFLFNSLNALTELVHQDADEAEKFVRQLSRVYRYVLEKRDVEVVSLQEELDFLKSFLFLQEIRQPNTLLVQWPEHPIQEAALPPLALQLLAENAIKHNVLDEANPLQLSLKIEGDRLLVQNKLMPRLMPQRGTGVGLSNLINRYKYLTDKPVGVEQTEAFFRVSLPLLKLAEQTGIIEKQRG